MCGKCRKSYFKKIIYFNWRLITLQYYGGFCHTSTWISHGCTCVPHPEPPSASYPSGLSQFISFKCPVSCIELGLVIYFTYGNINISMLFSQIIPPLPFLTPSKRLFCTSVSLLDSLFFVLNTSVIFLNLWTLNPFHGISINTIY